MFPWQERVLPRDHRAAGKAACLSAMGTTSTSLASGGWDSFADGFGREFPTSALQIDIHSTFCRLPAQCLRSCHDKELSPSLYEHSPACLVALLSVREEDSKIFKVGS